MSGACSPTICHHDNQSRQEVVQGILEYVEIFNNLQRYPTGLKFLAMAIYAETYYTNMLSPAKACCMLLTSDPINN